MEYVVGGVVVAFLLLLVFGALTGRLRMQSCCAPVDPTRDLRMRAAFEDDDAPS